MKITGSCFCGAVEYEAEVSPDRVAMCHCRDCQIFSGSAFRMAGLVGRSQFSFSKGEPKRFEKTPDSGKVRSMAFCGDCGTHLCSLPQDSEDDAAFVSIRLATAHQFDQLRPVAEIFCDSKVSWLGAVEGAMQFPRMPVLE
jgi:hypothetical protein